MKNFFLYFQLFRIEDWSKNFLIFIPIIFSNRLLNIVDLVLTIKAFFAFCLASSVVYILNDIIDLEKDKKSNLKKKYKPIARGEVSLKNSKIILFLLILFNFVFLFLFSSAVAIPIFFYIITNVFYSIYLKKIIFIELAIISSFYIVRAYTGALAIDVELSIYLILIIFFTSLFIITIKRKIEFDQKIFDTRPVLKKYKASFFYYFISFNFVTTLIIYSFYIIEKKQNLIFNLLLAFIIMLRYYLKSRSDKTLLSPIKIILQDIILQFLIFIWILFNIYELYFY